MHVQSRKIKVNQLTALTIRLLWMLALLMVSRLVFFGVNHTHFPGLSMGDWASILLGGLRFDIAALFYVNALYALLQLLPFQFRYQPHYQKLSRVVYISLNGLALLLNTADMAYFKFTLRRSTTMVLKEFANEGNIAAITLNSAIEFWYLVPTFGVLLFLLITGYNRVEVVRPVFVKPLRFYAGAVSLFLLFPVVFVGGIRGDWKYTTRPITMSNAGEYVKRPGDIPLVLNTPFCVFRTIKQQFYKEDNFFSEPQLSKLYNPIHLGDTSKNFRYENVVILVLESFGREAIGFLNKDLDGGNYKGYTPFLDSLFQHSYVCRNGFATGRKSIDALPAVLTGIPAGELPFVLTPYVSNQLQSLPAILQTKGYHTSFFHGAPNGSMGFKAFMNLIGVSHYYGKDEYGNDADFDGTWGILDEPFLQYFANQLDSFPEPFQSTLFTITSHEPFRVPAAYVNKFPKGKHPLHEVTGYTDLALRHFFKTAATKSWFKKTLFVITADHASLNFHPAYQTPWGQMAIPIAFYHPSDSLANWNDRIVQQTDIMPSVLSYLGYSKPYFAFGKNIFDPKTENFAINYNGGFQLFQDRYLLQLNGTQVAGLFDFQRDRLLTHNLVKENPAMVKEMEQKLKAFIQQYHNRLIKNQLLPPSP
jgi:phosphoglycerol transferase MdoB-like AlkP superfamily enzyme